MPDVLISNEGPVRKIRMNRPEKKNALTLAMYEAMAAAIEEAGTAEGVRCILIAGAPEVFCAGNDLNDFVTMARSGGLGAPIIRFLHALARCEKPMVAAVSGAAVGVGTTMLLHCDQVIAGDNAVLMTPFVSLGLLPEAGSSLIAPRLMGHARAFSLLVMGKPLTGRRGENGRHRQSGRAGRELDAQCARRRARYCGTAAGKRGGRAAPDARLGRGDRGADR